MKIDEISSPDLRPIPHDDPHSNICSQMELSIKEIERHSPGKPLPETLSAELNRCIFQLTPLVPLPNSIKLQIWKLSYRLWNACVDLSNAAGVKSSAYKLNEEHAKLRQVSADLLFLAGDVSTIPSPAFKAASFFYKTGLIWHELRKFDLANNCFEKATDLTSKVEISSVSDNEEKRLLLDLNIARSRTAWEVADRNLCITLLNRSKNLLFGNAENYKAVANQYLMFAKTILSKNEVSGVNEESKLMNEALELCEKGLRIVKRTEETLALKELKSKTLRFMAASHLQRDEFESALKCVKFLRSGERDQHPSLSVLAMKAWLGLSRFGEAEQELRSMVLDKGIPEGVWVSAVESYFQAVGTAGAETAKGVFLGLVGRCHVSAGAAIRIVNKVIGSGGCDGKEARVRAKVVADVVSDDRVVELFAGEAAANERTAMHAILWNCAAEHFRSKDFQTSAEIFEKSMLYVPYDIENRTLRAKGYRVLCLCHLGLAQLDRAEEYINEAEKLEPNIASAFLKFKVYLQKKNDSAATTQVQTMSSCLDFTTDFLLLSAHEAIACHSLPVAVASLSHILDLYSAGKPMPTTEVIIFRTLVTVLSQDHINDSDILKQMKRAHARMSELGPKAFFGKGEVGKRERNWFSVNAWNSGVRTGKEKNYDLCAEFFRLASEFYSAVTDEETEGNNEMVCQSLILAASAIIAHEKQRKGTLTETEVKQAISLLDRVQKILSSTSGSGENDNLLASIAPGLFFTYIWSAYDLYGRLSGMGPQQLVLIKQFANSKSCNVDHLLQIGLEASQGAQSNHEVAAFALNTCLSNLLASPFPDYSKVALILRKLISSGTILKGDTCDDAIMETYKQAYRIMVGLKEGEYPVEEAKWLSMTAWNRAAVPVRLGHIDTAKKWMGMGLELARTVPGMQTYRSCMEDFVVGFEGKIHGQNDSKNNAALVT
nr:TPR repeat-containing protein ZIP4 [Ipomoea batatas]